MLNDFLASGKWIKDHWIKDFFGSKDFGLLVKEEDVTYGPGYPLIRHRH
jgi:hypothetical protein